MDADAPYRARVVIVDDHAAFLETSARLLRAHHRVVATVGSGREALEAVERHDPDLLVLDLGLPDLPGLEVLAVLRARQMRTRVVVLTLHRERALAERAFETGATAYVTKARMARDLRPAIEAALRDERFCSPLPDPSGS